MNTYCLSCKKDTKNIDSKVIKTKNNRKMMSTLAFNELIMFPVIFMK